MSIFRPAHLLVQSNDGKAVTLTNESGMDNGKISQCTAIRLAQAVFSNNLPSLKERHKTLRIWWKPAQNITLNESITITLRTDIRYNLSTLADRINTVIEAAPESDYIAGKFPKNYLTVGIFLDRGILEITAKDCYEIWISENEPLGITQVEELTVGKVARHVNPAYAASSSATVLGTTFVASGDRLINLAPTDIVHVTCDLADGQDVVTNLGGRSRDIVATIPVKNTFGSINVYEPASTMPVEVPPGEVTDLTVKLLDRDLEEIDFRGEGWYASFELFYDAR